MIDLFVIVSIKGAQAVIWSSSKSAILGGKILIKSVVVSEQPSFDDAMRRTVFVSVVLPLLLKECV